MNVQPFVVETLHGLIAVAHNGELVNANSLKTKVSDLKIAVSTCLMIMSLLGQRNIYVNGFPIDPNFYLQPLKF